MRLFTSVPSGPPLFELQLLIGFFQIVTDRWTGGTNNRNAPSRPSMP